MFVFSIKMLCLVNFWLLVRSNSVSNGSFVQIKLLSDILVHVRYTNIEGGRESRKSRWYFQDKTRLSRKVNPAPLYDLLEDEIAFVNFILILTNVENLKPYPRSVILIHGVHEKHCVVPMGAIIFHLINSLHKGFNVRKTWSIIERRYGVVRGIRRSYLASLYRYNVISPGRRLRSNSLHPLRQVSVVPFKSMGHSISVLEAGDRQHRS